KLFSGWVAVAIHLDARAGLITVKCGDSTYTEKLAIDQKSCLKVLFGYNDYKEFKTTDVPAMKIRNVKILAADRLLHHWPLDLEAGTEVDDEIKGMTASVINPQWIKR